MRAESWRWREIAGPGFMALPVVNLKLNTLQVFPLDLGGRNENKSIWTRQCQFGLSSQASHIYLYTRRLDLYKSPHS